MIFLGTFLYMTYNCQITLGKYVTHRGRSTVERRQRSQIHLHSDFSPNIQMPTAQDEGNPRAAAAKKSCAITPKVLRL